VKAVHTGITRTCVILENDRVKCMGRNDAGPDILGTGDNIGWGGAATRVGDAMPFIDLGVNPATAAPWRVLALDVGDSMTCALLENARLKCWGGSALGSTGNPTGGNIGDSPADMGDSLAFLDLGLDPATGQPWQVQAVSCGKYHACAVLTGNVLKCWGYNAAGQLGLEDNNNRGDNAGEMGDQLPIVQLQ
jgi:alpha-tubulin suppressor-like RCC1 family protein